MVNTANLPAEAYEPAFRDGGQLYPISYQCRVFGACPSVKMLEPGSRMQDTPQRWTDPLDTGELVEFLCEAPPVLAIPTQHGIQASASDSPSDIARKLEAAREAERAR